MGYIYKPKHVRQLLSGDKWGKYNCTATSAAMAIDRHTMGGIQVTGQTIRAASTEPTPDPQSPGLNLPQIVNVAFKWHVSLENRSGAPWASLIKALEGGRGVILQGDYDQLGEFSCQASFDGPHAIYVNHITGDLDLYVYDPLCKGANANVPQEVVKAYATKLARAWNMYPGLPFATTRITPTIAIAQT